MIMTEATGKSKTLFVRNLPFTLTNAELEEKFGVFGPMKKCFVVGAPGNAGTNRGFGYVTYSLGEDASSALEKLNNTPMGDRRLKIIYSEKKRELTREELEEKEAKAKDVDYETLTEAKVQEEKAVKTARKPKSARSQPANGGDGRTTVIYGLPLDNEKVKSKLEKDCKSLGDVENVSYEMINGVQCACVLYKTHKQSRRAVKFFSAKEYGGKKAECNVRTKFQKVDAPRKSKKFRLIIRNVSWKCDAEELKSSLASFGEIVDFNMPLGPKGKCKGFAFAEFSDSEGAAKAVEGMNGKDVRGRPIAVDWAVSKTVYEKANNDDAENKEGDNGGEKAHEEASDEEDDEDDSEEGGEAEEDVDDVDNDDEDDGNEIEKLQENEDGDDNDDSNDDHDSDDVQEGKTVFITNLCFETTDKTVFEKFRRFGKIYYCRLVKNPETGLPKGTAFVKFVNKDSADKCVEEIGPEALLKGQGLCVDGRILNVMMAVERKEANERKEEKSKKKKAKETQRNLFLAKEGIIAPDSEAAKHMTKEDLARRMAAWKEKKAKLANPNYFVSDVRLAVRNLPKTCLDNDLRNVFQSVGGKKLSLCKAKVIKSKDDRKGGKLVPTGFAFVEYKKHEDALAALREYNNSPSCFDKRRPIVEFSVENRIKLKQHEMNLKRRKMALAKKTVGDENKEKVMPFTAKKREIVQNSENDENGKLKTKAQKRKKSAIQQVVKKKTKIEEQDLNDIVQKKVKKAKKKKKVEVKDDFDNLLSKYRSKVSTEKANRWFAQD